MDVLSLRNRLWFCVMLAACGGQQQMETTQPEAARERCESVRAEFAKALAAGKHTPVTLQRRDPTATWTEQETADFLAKAPAGTQTWVLARGGAGKGQLAWALESHVCERLLTIRLAAGDDLRARFVTATPRKPALAQAILARLAQTSGEDAAESLREALGRRQWLLIIDGADELSPRERRLLGLDLQWLARADLAQPHLLRFERPGTTEAAKPTTTLNLPELTCDRVDVAWARKFDTPASLAAATLWRGKHGLDRRRAGTDQCKYVHMATWRDLGTVADLARDAAEGHDELAFVPTRADIYATWLSHRLRVTGVLGQAGLGWLDRLVALGVVQASEPDLLITADRCAAATAPGGLSPTDACPQLLQSPALRPSGLQGAWALQNQTLADLLLARWLVARTNDCALLSAATGDLRSLEITAMVTAQPSAQRCLASLVGVACGQAGSPGEAAAFLDEALPREPQVLSLLDKANDEATNPCEREVLRHLRTPPPAPAPPAAAPTTSP